MHQVVETDISIIIQSKGNVKETFLAVTLEARWCGGQAFNRPIKVGIIGLHSSS